MSFLVPLTLFGWIPAVIALFAVVPARWATGLAFAAGWCFLPVAGYDLPGLPDYTKMFATSVGVFLGLAIFYPNRFLQFSPSWLDIPAFVFCLSPLGSSLSNDLGIYDGFSAALNTTVSWGLPYLIGRCVYRDVAELEALAWSIVACGLIYVPLCLWEVRMSPQLHRQVYGFHQHSFAQTARFDGWRPTVFMQHGLMVGMWMGCCLLIAIFAWRGGRMKSVRGLPIWPWIAALAVTFLLLKSLGAWLLIALGWMLLELAQGTRSRWVFATLPLIVVGFLGLRYIDRFPTDSLVQFTREWVNDDRANSLQFRFDNEQLLLGRAAQRPLLGWGSWGRNRVFDDQGRDISTTDGLWIIVLGTQGLVGLVSLYGMLLVGPTMTLIKASPILWTRLPATAFTCGLAIVCCLFAIDTLPNSMVVPVFIVCCGALVTASKAIGSADSLDALHMVQEIDQQMLEDLLFREPI